MKYCTHCGTQCKDDASFCTACGTSFDNALPAAKAEPKVDPDDHTADFSADDISKNKLYAVIAYLFSILGLLIASICVKDSPYVDFNKRNALKLLIVEFIALLLLFVPFVGWAALGVIEVMIIVIKIIAIVNVFCNKAKDLPIIKDLKFLD